MRNHLVALASIAVLLVTITLLDGATALFHLTVLYAIPVIIATWAFGLAGGLTTSFLAVASVAVTHSLLHSPTLAADVLTDLVVFVFAAVVVDRLRAQLRTIRRLEARRDFELGIARDIQSRMLNPPPADERFDVAYALHFAREVGGDYYRFDECERQLYLFAGDISGKAISAALFAVLLDEAIADALSCPGDPLETLVRAVNDRMYARMPPEMFVTMLFAVFDDEGMWFVNAGHVRPLLYRAPLRCAIELPEGATLALGIEPSVPVRPARVELAHGDALLICSDGVTESRALIDDPGRLRSLFEETAEAGPEAAVEAVTRLAESRGQTDDVTVICVRRR